ncbi:heavy-metal-associated domain-containing protein [Magnetofaba australis]|uniref:heavy-metal-associated domain-containing protein n=1 Tax=Magnetofaba australis TaxID=1472297 RepID=UPI000A19B6B8|nr:copper ion binding protein [Magnetofaba australis]
MSAMQFKVSGMSCQHCVGAVEKALDALDAVEEVNIDLEAATVTVEGDDSARDAIAQAITDAGYPVQG